jgi:mannosyltransferase
MLLTLGLSYFFFMHQSLRLDEAQSLWQSSRSPGDILTLVSQDVHVPLFHEILHFWRLYIGDSVDSARGLSLFFYLLCIPAIYFLGKLSYDRTVGIFGALLLTISPFMNWYGNEIRMYTLLTFVTLLNQYFFVKILRKGKLIYGSREYTSTWFGYGLTAIIGCFVHYFFFLNLLSQAVYYFARRSYFPERSLRNFMICAAVVAAAVVPWFLYVYSQGQAGFQTPLLPTPTTVNLFSAFSQFLFGFQNDNLNTIFLSLWPITIIFGFLTLRHSTRISAVSEYLLTSVLVSILLAFAVSFITPVFVSRYLIFTVPAIFLLLSSLFESYRPQAAFLARTALVGLMVVTLGIEIVSPTTPVKEDYFAAAQYMQQNATAQDVVILSAPFTVYPVQYYYRGTAPLATLPAWDQYSYGPIPAFDQNKLPNQVAQETNGAQNVWLLLSYNQGYQSNVQQYFDSHYQRILAKDFSPGMTLYEYKLRYDTTTATHAATSTTAGSLKQP